MERHKAARMRELGPDHHLLELQEIGKPEFGSRRCAAGGGSYQQPWPSRRSTTRLCRDVAKRASRKGVKDHDLFDVDDIETEEAAVAKGEH